MRILQDSLRCRILRVYSFENLVEYRFLYVYNWRKSVRARVQTRIQRKNKVDYTRQIVNRQSSRVSVLSLVVSTHTLRIRVCRTLLVVTSARITGIQVQIVYNTQPSITL